MRWGERVGHQVMIEGLRMDLGRMDAYSSR